MPPCLLQTPFTTGDDVFHIQGGKFAPVGLFNADSDVFAKLFQLDLSERVFFFQQAQTFADNFPGGVELSALNFGVHQFFQLRRQSNSHHGWGSPFGTVIVKIRCCGYYGQGDRKCQFVYNSGMRSLRFALLPLLLLLAAPLAAKSPAKTPARADRPELRAFWVDGFNDGFKTPAQCDLLLSRLRAMHCNAVFVQMRKRADAYYASHYEDWAKDDTEKFDALQYLCAQAHAPGQPRIQIHAWINACAVGGNASAGALTKLHPEWLSLSDTGADFDEEATKIDPGNPQAADWTFRVYMDVVRHYDVDGIHLDFIRYGGDGKTVGHWGYNPISIARFNARYGRAGQPAYDDPRWQAWRRAQVTALVRRVYVGATALKPKLVVSAATICWGDAPKDDVAYETKSASYIQVFAPWRDWLREGILDLNCPMTYFAVPKSAAKWQNWNTFTKDRQYGRQCALGVAAYLNSVPTSLALVKQTRQPTARGNKATGTVLYCYDTTVNVGGQEVQGDTALFAALPGVFARDVPPPPMPWKNRPRTGAVQGTLLAGDALSPVDGASVTATRKDGKVRRTGWSDGNGCFELASLPPGLYHLSAAWKTGETLSRQAWEARVRPGATVRLRMVRPGPASALAPQVTGIGILPEGTRVVLEKALVTSGSAPLGGYFFVADGFGQPAVRVDAPGLVPPAVMGDQVAVAGTIHHTGGGVTLTADAVRLVGMEMVKVEKPAN